MSHTNELLDKVREVCSLRSDTELAERLHVTRGLVSGWRNQRYPMPPDHVIEVCRMAKLDAALWTAQINAENAKSADARKMWENAARRLARAAVIMLAALPALSPAPAFAKAEGPTSYALCAVRRLARFLGVTGVSCGASHGPPRLLAA